MSCGWHFGDESSSLDYGIILIGDGPYVSEDIGNMQQRMSRKDDGWDNASTERFSLSFQAQVT